ncbi:PLxRFG domain-containing protein [Psychrobacter sp. AOP7-B1-24]|uniref:PLxRFG domain-containing protein n=1 Tax=Psychrobacter sp. AOP7-B1-24 TaxID=3457645 RepID=UPI00402BEDC8
MDKKKNQEDKPYDRKSAIDAAMAGAPAQKKGVGGHLRDTGLSLLSGAISVPETAVGLSDIATGGQVGKTLENQGGAFGFRPKEAKEAIASWKTEEGKEQLRKFQDTEGLGSKVGYALDNPSLITNTVAESLPAMGAGGVVGRGIGLAAKGLSPVAAGALGEGAVGAGLAAESIRQQTDDGLLTPKQTGLAAATGATTAGFGFAGGKLAKQLGIADFDTSLVSGNLAGRTAAEIAEGAPKQPGIAKRVAGGALSEGFLEELPQSVSETILQNEALGRPLDEGVTDAAALGLLSGAAMGGFAGGMTRNRASVRDDITPTEDMGQEAPRLGLPNPNKPSGGELVSQSQRYNQNPNNPNWIEDANPDYFNRGQGPNAANMRNLTPDPELPYNSELGGQFSAAQDGTVFSESEYNDFLAAQQAQARAARDAGMSDINDVTQVPQGYEQAGNDPRLPAPDGTDFTASQDGQVYGRDDINTRLSQERDAAAERRARIARGEIIDRTPIPEAPKPSELMGLDPNKGSLSAAAALAVDSGASPVAAEFEQASAPVINGNETRMAGLLEVENKEQPTGSKWLQDMRTALASSDIDNGTYQALSQSIEADPKSVPERARLKKAIDALPKKPEPTAKKIDPKARVIDEAKAQTVAYNPRGDKIPLQFDVVDASELLSSHSNNFVENPNYPQQYQPRDRADAGYQAQVLNIVKKFNPELLGKDNSVNAGSPIVGRDDNLVESGNGRTIAIRRMYESGKGDAYRQFVNKSAEEFGIDTNAVNQMRQPVLVRRNNSDMDREQFALRANAPTGAAMSSSERAKADAKILPNADLLELDSNGGLNLKGSYKFTQAFISSLDKNEVNELVLSNGDLSQTGQNRVSGALLQSAYGSSKLTKAVTEDIDASAKNMLKTLVDKAPQITKINQSIKEGNRESNTLAEDIKTAAETYIDLVESGANIDDYLNMEDMFGEGISPQSKEIVRDFYSNARSATRMGSRLQARIDATNRVNAPDLLADFEADAPNVLSNEPATQLTDENPTVNIPVPRQSNRPKVESTEPPVRDVPIGEWVDGMNKAIDSNLAKQKTGSTADAPKTTAEASPTKPPHPSVAKSETAPEAKKPTAKTESSDNPSAAGGWQTQINGNEFRINEDGITVRKHDRVVHIRGASSIAASQKAKELAGQDIRELHYISAKENTSDPFSEGSIWLNDEGDMVRKKGTKKPTGSLLPILKQTKGATESAPKKSNKPATPSETVTEIEDFGEKVTGARKDMQSFYQKEMTDDDIISQPLSKIWPKKDIDAIEDTQMAALATALRSTIPSKPRKGYKLGRWVDKVKSTRGIMQNMLSGDMPADEFVSQLTQVDAVSDIGYHAQLLAKLDKDKWSRVSKVDPQIGYRRPNEAGEYVPFIGFAVTIDKRTHTFNTEQRDISEIIDKVNNLLAGDVKAPTLKFDVYSKGRGDNKSYFITQASDKDKTPLIEFNDLAAARAFKSNNSDELVDLWNQHKERVNVKKSDMRSSTNRERIGPDHRSGQDITTEQFMNTFGLRGGQFGNWVKQGANSKDRQRMLNDTYDAFMDLVGVLNIPPEAIGLGGKLAMSFGARGKGRAMAHYEPSQVIINLTKTKGAGSLAHEWFHALDHHFTSFRDDAGRNTSKENAYITYKPEPMLIMKDQKGKPSRMRPITEARRKQIYEMNKNRAYLPENFLPDSSHKEGVRPQVETAFANLVETLNDSPMKARSITIDKGAADGYWSRIIERAARAFEGYVINKLEKQGARSDFLANITPEDAFPRNMDRYPYLLQSEMAPVAEAFDNLFATIDSKASENGNGKTLFSRAGQLNQAIDRVKAGAVGSTQTTRQQVLAKLNDKFGKETIDKLMADDKLDIKVLSDFMQDGKLTIPSDVDGLYHNGKATLIADNLSDDMIIPTFLHELGGHGGMQTLMDKKAYDALMKDFDALVKAGDPLAMQAKAMADKVARNEQDALDEYLPYLITLASRQQVKQGKVAGMINRMVMAIRSWLRNTLGVPIAINSQDILSLAERMVNEVEKQGSLDNVTNAAPQFSDPNSPDMRFSDTNVPAKQLDDVHTPAFKKWFGDSKVVDGNGNPLVVYHGTNANFNTFSASDVGIHVGTEDQANSRAEQKEGDDFKLMPLYVKAENPLRLKDARSWKDPEWYLYESGISAYLPASLQQKISDFAQENRTAKDLSTPEGQKKAHKKAMAINSEVARFLKDELGYDSIVYANTHDGTTQDNKMKADDSWIVFDPEQIKSATDNVGTFDTNNPDIRYSRAAGMNDQLDPRNIARESMTRLYDWASSAPPGKLSWWHKTIGTMYNLAKRNPYFKPVFENTEKFINDVSFYAAKASEFAPRLLPQLDSIRDITKSAIGAKDNDAISKPIFEGTLLWGRDLNGKAVLVDDWRKKVMATSKQDRLQMLKDAGKITPEQLTKLASLNNIQANRFINGIIDEEVSAGLVWTDNEMRAKFDLSDEQIGLYREFRDATDASLDSLTRSDMLKQLGRDGQDIEATVMEAESLDDAFAAIQDHVASLIKDTPKKEKALNKTLQDIKNSMGRTKQLKSQGYAPLSRFGQYTVDVVDKDGNREYFGMFESAYDARKMKAEMDALYGNDDNFTVTQGALSNEEFKLFAGVTPETAELFGEMLGLDATGDKEADAAFQEYLRRTKNNRSAMKRLMHRKGIKGYSEDVGRVLASFIYSNARHTSAALNMGNLDRSISEIPKGEGQLKDAAVKLAEYIKNPQEEGQVIRGWMFAQYLGGSVASAVVNLTQPIAVSFPYLSQFGGAVKAAKELSRSSSDWAKSLKNKNNDHFEEDLQKAIDRAEADGTLSPQEVHNLLKQASGKNPLRAGDGTKVGDAKAMAGNAISRVSLAWGTLFSAAEQVNRRVTFVAAYRMAKDQGMSNPAEFATKSIKETQFVYNKASRMRWGRGAVGGTLMTFKTYTVSYMELMHRLWTQGEKGSPERKQGRQAVGIMVGTLFLLGGAGGLPFMEDAEDLIDGIGQIMGYNFSSKKVRQEFLDNWVGEFAGDFIDGGISSVSGSPTDVSGRLGLGNLIPGTGVFKERTSNTRDALELLGPAGDFVGRVASGSRSLAKGVANLDDNELKKGALEFAPVAVRNAIKGADMATSGIYKDTKGYKVADVSPVDAAFKGLGFQPRDISKIQEANYLGQSATSYYNLRASNIRALWAAGVVEGNQTKVADARAAVKDWNAKNPDQKIIIKPSDIARRVREMRMDKVDRVIKRAPRTARSGVAQELNSVRDNM